MRDHVEHDRKVVFVAEDNTKEGEHSLKHIEDEIVEDGLGGGGGRKTR